MQVAETEALQASKDVGQVLELDGVWTRVADKNAGLKVARNKRGGALAAEGGLEDTFVGRPSRRRQRLNIASAERFNNC